MSDARRFCKLAGPEAAARYDRDKCRGFEIHIDGGDYNDWVNWQVSTRWRDESNLFLYGFDDCLFV